MPSDRRPFLADQPSNPSGTVPNLYGWMRDEILSCLGFGRVVIGGIKFVRGQRQPKQIDAHGLVFFLGHSVGLVSSLAGPRNEAVPGGIGATTLSCLTTDWATVSAIAEFLFTRAF